jgi:multiple sugar transport system permease protein
MADLVATLNEAPDRVFAARERRFAAALLAPAFVALLATTTFPLL